MKSSRPDQGNVYQGARKIEVGTGDKGFEKRPRDRYFDALRAVALVRVVVFHMFSWAWLSMVFPSMGVMFALGGSLMATSMQRSVEQAIIGRLRRLLPALWAMGAVLIPLMLGLGWAGHPDWPNFLLWVVPVVVPPSSEWAEPLAGVLWYLVAYLWLVLLSPLLNRCYRRSRLLTLATPLVALYAWDRVTLPVNEALASAVTDVLTFATCWMLGFAHRYGDLRRVHLAVLLPVSAALIAGGLAWTVAHPGDEGVDLSSQPIAYGAYSAGFVLLLMRVSPRLRFLDGNHFISRFVNFCNARAVTIYLWHNAAIGMCFTVGSAISVERVGPRFEMLAFFLVALALLAVLVAVLGWVEDLAARRRVSIFPWRSVPPSRPRAARPEWSGPIWW